MNKTLKEIIDQGLEFEAIKILERSIERKNLLLEFNNREMAACLNAIKKINNGKNEAIASLCEKDTNAEKWVKKNFDKK